jgi:hypothetical protein
MSRIAHLFSKAASELLAWMLPARAPAPIYVHAYYRRRTGAVRPPAIRR